MPDYRVVPGPAHIHPFATAVAGDDLIFISGLAHPVGGMAEQVRGSVAQIRDILEGVGSSLEEIVYLRPVVSSHDHIEEFNATIDEELPHPLPAVGALLVAGLVHPEILAEFEVIAQRGARLIPPTD